MNISKYCVIIYWGDEIGLHITNRHEKREKSTITIETSKYTNKYIFRQKQIILIGYSAKNKYFKKQKKETEYYRKKESLYDNFKSKLRIDETTNWN